MKKILMVGILAIAMTACTKKGQDWSDTKITPLYPSQFVYSASPNIKVQVSEFKDESGKECMIVHANYMYADSTADISCVSSRHAKTRSNTKIIKQHVYKAGNTDVQVTNIYSKYSHDCTIVHANYYQDTSKATVDCQP